MGSPQRPALWGEESRRSDTRVVRSGLLSISAARDDDVAISTDLKGYNTPPEQNEEKVYGGHFSACAGEVY